MFPVYGLAECAVGLTFPPLGRGPRIDRVDRRALSERGRAVPTEQDEPSARRFVGCGHPLPGHELRIVGPGGTELPERQEGRVQFRGPSATSGYFRNPEATRRLFDGDWLDSGDLGYLAAGELFITGRSKDIILRAGRNIYPEEIEEVVGDLPGIRKGRVVVFGAPDPGTGTERLMVLAETREQDAARRDALSAEVAARVTDLTWTAPDEVVLAPPDTVLKTSSGKLRRADSRERYLKGRIGRRGSAARWQVLRLSLRALGAAFRRSGRLWVKRSYSAYAWGVFRVIAVTTAMLVVITPNERLRWPLMRRALHVLARVTATSLTVEGRQHLPAQDEPCVLVSNHCSYLDSYALMAAVPRPLSFVAKAELRANRWFELFLGRIGTVFVERFDARQSAEDARRLAERALEGRSLMIYPEGTFSRMPGLLPFHLGAFVTAVQAGIPVVPIAIRGTRYILRGSEHRVHHGAISVVIGPAIDPKSSLATDPWQRALHLRDQARAFILDHNREPDLACERAPVEVAHLADRTD
jgi:1-acyl-sn-glycerol-3-phosphate acyltransferase